MKVLVALMLSIIWAMPCTARAMSPQEEKETLGGDAARGCEVARLNGKAIYRGDLNYDLEKRYAFELHTMKIKLYREQKAALMQFIDRMLLEEEAGKRNIPPDDLTALINGKAEREAQRFEDQKEELFQEFVKKMQRDVPSFARNRSGLTLPAPVMGLLTPENSSPSPFIEEVKNKVVEMKKASYLNDSKEAFSQGLRAQARIEIHLERPELLRLDLPPGEGPRLGNIDAPITIVSFIDFQCPYCKKMNSTLKDLLATQKEKIKIVARNFPLSAHPEAAGAAQAAACAHDQGRYWDYHDLLFDNQQALDINTLREYAGLLGLDRDKFSRCLEGSGKQAELEKERSEALLAGISTTPSILINGYYLSGSPTLHYLKEVIAAVEKGHVPRVEEDPGKG